MKCLTATLCLTIAVLLGSGGMSWSADFQKGWTAYESGDYATALRELKPLAEQGNAKAQYLLYIMYSNRLGVPRNHKKRAKWVTLSADQGYPPAQYALGKMYKDGFGVPKNLTRAQMWFIIAATTLRCRGVPCPVSDRDGMRSRLTPTQLKKAQDLARVCFRKGKKGCAATMWNRVNNDKGVSRSQFEKGMMYYEGKGVPKDNVRARMWFILATTSGKVRIARKYSRGVRRQMTPSQIEKSEDLARECVRKKYKGC